MQPTVSPWAWVSSWERRARTRAAAGEYARSRDRAATRAREHDKYAIYGLRKDGRHFIRLDPLGKTVLLSRQWGPTSAPVTWRVERAHHTEPWALPVPVPDIKSIQGYRPYEPVPIVLGETAGAQRPLGGVVGGPGPLGGVVGGPRPLDVLYNWSNGLRGWATAALILGLLVLIVRAAENCLHKKLFKAIYTHTNAGAAELQRNEIRPGHYRLQGVRRQESDEWSTPNVMATSLQLQHRDFDAESLDDSSEPPPLPVAPNSDRPPPYSECARPGHTTRNKRVSEEPPPPYSACDVAYTHREDAEPRVHIHWQNVRHERPHSSTDMDNAQNNLIENGLRGETDTMTTRSNDNEVVAPGMRTELVFDNGRIVERPSGVLKRNNNDTAVAINDHVEEQSTRHAECNDRVVYIDETVAENTSRGRALLV